MALDAASVYLLFSVGVARSRSKRESDDRIGNSVLKSESANENRTRQERRVGSGSVRMGRARTMREIGVVSSSKTGPDGPREVGDRTCANKRPSRH